MAIEPKHMKKKKKKHILDILERGLSIFSLYIYKFCRILLSPEETNDEQRHQLTL